MGDDQIPEYDVAKNASINDLEAEFVDVDGIKTRYYEVGSGEPMVLLHGGSWHGWSSANTWYQNIAALGETYRVIAPDRLGNGMTDNPDREDDYVYQSEVKHMEAFLEKLGVDEFHLVGQSRGGGLAGRLAVKHNERVQTLVVANSQTLAMEAGDYFFRRERTLRNPPADEESPTYYEDKARHMTELHSYTSDNVTDEYVKTAAYMRTRPKAMKTAEVMDSGQRIKYRKSLREAMRDTQNRIRDGELNMPTLLYWGRNDTTTSLREGIMLYDMIAQTNPYVRIKVINESSHSVYKEHPDEFNHDIDSFVQFWKDLDVDDREVRQRWMRDLVDLK